MTTVFFACVHNAGRSQMAAALFNKLADPSKARAVSAGTTPGERVYPEVVAVMREEGIDLGDVRPWRDSTRGGRNAICIAVRHLAGAGLIRSIAVAILLLAGTEIVFCAQCSPDSCTLSHWPTHEQLPSSDSGDQCLCCCAHLVIALPVHVEPIAMFEAMPRVASPSLPRAPLQPVFHPPQT